MNINPAITFSIGMLLYFAYVAFRWFSRHKALTNAYKKELRDLITNEKYQVKGRFE